MVSGPRPFTGLWADAETGSGLTHSFPQAASHIPMGVAAAELHGPSLAPTWLCHTVTHELVLRSTAHHQGAAEANGAHLHPHTVTTAQSSGRAEGRLPPPTPPRPESSPTGQLGCPSLCGPGSGEAPSNPGEAQSGGPGRANRATGWSPAAVEGGTVAPSRAHLLLEPEVVNALF